jgi:organic radical activating enzyme
MAKFEWSEVFTSIEGEGPYAGVPTAYIRFTKCNFMCKGFNNPTHIDTETNIGLGFDPTKFKTLKELPPITLGCDSIYAWDNRFAHLWQSGNEEQLIDAVLDTIPHKSWVHPVTGQPVILSLTGGEPTLRQKQLSALLNHPKMDDCKHLLIETNCSVPIRDDFINLLNSWWKPGRKITFANSPKLRASGEKWEDAIKPEVALAQQRVKRAEQYFKFVCDANAEDFDEVERAMKVYWDAGVVQLNNVLIMPTACTEEQQTNIAATVANMCIEKGYTFCYRVHVPVFKNAIGT